MQFKKAKGVMWGERMGKGCEMCRYGKGGLAVAPIHPKEYKNLQLARINLRRMFRAYERRYFFTSGVIKMVELTSSGCGEGCQLRALTGDKTNS